MIILVPFCSVTSNVTRILISLHSHPDLLYFLFKMTAILMDRTWSLTVLQFCHSVRTGAIELNAMCALTICITPLGEMWVEVPYPFNLFNLAEDCLFLFHIVENDVSINLKVQFQTLQSFPFTHACLSEGVILQLRSFSRLFYLF